MAPENGMVPRNQACVSNGRVRRSINLVMICVIFIMTVSTFACQKETEQDKIKRVITDTQKAAEQKNSKEVIEALAETYSDPQGFNRDTIRRLLLGYFLQHPKISVYVSNLRISIEGASAEALFQAILTSGNKTGSITDVVPQSLGVYDFTVSLKKESKDWKVFSATWEQVGQ